MVKADSGCAYGEVNRNMIQNLNNGFIEFRDDIKREFNDLRDTNIKLYNHLSNRLPPWATAVGAIGIAVVSILIGAFLGGNV